MFGFYGMLDNYESRKVANTKVNEGIIDTCAVTDSSKPYETGIQHSQYNSGNWVIVELYDTKEQALTGHNKWVKAFSGKKLPAQITDVNTCDIQKLAKAVGHTFHKSHKKANKR